MISSRKHFVRGGVLASDILGMMTAVCCNLFSTTAVGVQEPGKAVAGFRDGLVTSCPKTCPIYIFADSDFSVLASLYGR